MIFGDPPTTLCYHLGVHATDEDLLVRSLLRDAGALGERGVLVPRPRRYRQAVRDTMHQHRGEPMPEAEQAKLFETIAASAVPRRLILSDEQYLCLPQGVYDGGELYAKSGFRTVWLRYLFPENPCEFFLAIRNPATLIPALLAMNSMPGYDKLVGDAAPMDLRWPDVVRRIVTENPGCPVTVWCNEDTPMIWPEVLRTVSGVEDVAMSGDLDVLRTIMTEAGAEKMEAYLRAEPPHSVDQRRQVTAAFADKFAMADEIEEEIDLPGWTSELVEEVSAQYDADTAEIAGMQGVRFISA